MIVFAAFWILALATWARKTAEHQAAFGPRDGGDWLLDLSGLFMQGVIVPLAQTTALYFFFSAAAPRWKGAIEMSPIAAFLLNFVFVDYLYYWNHRALHASGLWRWHAVHHTAEHMDVFVTARNTFWTPVLIAYIWVNAAGVFVLKDPKWFLLSAALTAALDLWRHSEIYPTKGFALNLYRMAAKLLITPEEHAWHHSAAATSRNFGANLKIWDRLHGTYYFPGHAPASLGISMEMSFFEKFLFPAKI